MKKAKPKIGHLVWIECDDIEHLSPGWQHWRAAVKDKPNRYRFVGWVLKRTKRFIHISSATNSDGAVHSSYRIPLGSSTKIVELKEPLDVAD